MILTRARGAFFLSILMVSCSTAQAQGPTSAFDALAANGSRLERPTIIDVQKALIWTGDYSGSVDGDAGKGTRSAIGSWQRSQNVPATETLSEEQAQRLFSQGVAKRELWQWRTHQIGSTGFTVGYPARLLTSSKTLADGGVELHSADQRSMVQVTVRRGIASTTVDQDFARISQSTSDRTVEYFTRKDDWSVISGVLQSKWAFYLRTEFRSGTVVALTVAVPVEERQRLSFLVTAIASSFRVQDSQQPGSPNAALTPQAPPSATNEQGGQTKSCLTRGATATGTLNIERGVHPNGSPIDAFMLRLPLPTCAIMFVFGEKSGEQQRNDIQRIQLAPDNDALRDQLRRQVGQTASIRLNEILAPHAASHIGDAISTQFSALSGPGSDARDRQAREAEAAERRRIDIAEQQRREAAAMEAARREIAELEVRAKSGDYGAAMRGAERARAAGDQRKEIEFLILGAERAPPALKLAIARKLLEGADGFPKDPEKGRTLLEQASTAGHGPSLLLLAELESRPDGSTEDNNRAFELYEKAAVAGEATAREKLAQLKERALQTDRQRQKEMLLSYLPVAGGIALIGALAALAFGVRRSKRREVVLDDQNTAPLNPISATPPPANMNSEAVETKDSVAQVPAPISAATPVALQSAATPTPPGTAAAPTEPGSGEATSRPDFIDRYITASISRGGPTDSRQLRDIALISRFVIFFIYYFFVLLLPLALDLVLLVGWISFESLMYVMSRRLRSREASSITTGYLNKAVRWGLITTLVILALWNMPWRFVNAGAAQRECLNWTKYRAKDRDSVERREVQTKYDTFPDGTRQLSMYMGFSAKNGFGAVGTDTMICSWRLFPGTSTWVWQGQDPDTYSFRVRPID